MAAVLWVLLLLVLLWWWWCCGGGVVCCACLTGSSRCGDNVLGVDVCAERPSHATGGGAHFPHNLLCVFATCVVVLCLCVCVLCCRLPPLVGCWTTFRTQRALCTGTWPAWSLMRQTGVRVCVVVSCVFVGEGVLFACLHVGVCSCGSVRIGS